MTPRPAEVPYNAANPAHVDHARSVDARTAQDRLYALRETLRTYEGRRVCWELLVTCGVFDSVFSPDALAMAFRAGQQAIGQQWRAALVEADASLYDQMAREARARAKQEAAVSRAVLAQGEDGEQDGEL